MHSVDAPIRTSHGTAFQALFFARSRALSELTRVDGLAVVNLLPRWSVLAVSVLHHVDADPEPYYELSLAWPVQFEPAVTLPLAPLLLGTAVKDVGWWIHRSVVSSQRACDIGRQRWGFPRTVGSFRVSRTGDEVMTEVSDSLGTILRLRASVNGRIKSSRHRVALMSRVDRQLLRTVVELEAAGFDDWGRPWRRPSTAVDLWEHPRLAGLTNRAVVASLPIVSRVHRDFRMALGSPHQHYRLGPEALPTSSSTAEERPRLTLVT